MVLNRHYKPLGFLTNDWVDYEAYPVVMKFKGLTPKVAAKLSYKGSEDLAMIYLYNDGCVPTNSAQHMQVYLQRLAVLTKLKVEGKRS